MNDLHKDIEDLLAAARNAIGVLRGNAEEHERQGMDASAEREAVRKLTMGIQLVEYDLYNADDPGEHLDWDRMKL